MFAVELHFDDGISADELIVVRRDAFIIGSTDDADVMIEGAANAGRSVQIRRKAGRRFSAAIVGLPSEQTFEGAGDIELGSVQLTVIPLDLDLLLAAGESMDRGGLRVLGRALAAQSPEFPALRVDGGTPFTISFPADYPILIGRSRSCAVRVDGNSVAAEHLRVGSAKGSAEFWMEPASQEAAVLSGGIKISGRAPLAPNTDVQLGEGGPVIRLLVGAVESQIAAQAAPPPPVAPVVDRFPCLVSKSELMRPERYPLIPGRRVSIGRDPANDVWLNASHISRLHAELIVGEDESVQVVDHSSNGTFIGGERLTREFERGIPKGLTVIDFARGMTVGVCYSPKEEEEYLGKNARPRRSSSLHGQILSQITIPVTPFNSDEDQEPTPPSWYSQQTSEASPSWNASEIRASENFRRPPLLRTSFESPAAYAPAETQEEVQSPERIEEFSPAKRFGLSGRVGTLAFWAFVVFLVIMNYYVWIYLADKN